MNLSLLTDTLDAIKDSPSRLEKEDMIADILKSDNAEVFKYLCSFLFNNYIRLHVKVTQKILDDAEELCNAPIADESIWDNFISLTNALADEKISGNDAREVVTEFLSFMDEDVREWFAMFLNKNWKVGVGRPTLEKFLGRDFAPHFDIQLCEKWSSFKKRGLVLPRPYIVQRKIDGVRAAVGCFPKFGGKRVALSRKGHEYYNWEHIRSVIDEIEFHHGSPCVVDGEFFYYDFERTMEIVRRETRRHPDQDKLRFHVFDILPLQEWIDGTCSKTLEERDLIIQSLVAKADKYPVLHVEHDMAQSNFEVEELLGKNVELGWEGIVIKNPLSKYAYDRTDDWFKDKLVDPVDAMVVGVKLGRHDPSTNEIFEEGHPRYNLHSIGGGMVVRALIVDPGNGILTDVGSGLKMDDRYKFYEMSQEGLLDGRMIEAHFQGYTPAGKLRFPRYKTLRADK